MWNVAVLALGWKREDDLCVFISALDVRKLINV